MEARWSARLGPPIAALAGLTLVAASVASAGPPWRVVGACPDAAPATISADRPTLSAERFADAPWFRLDPVLDATGAVAGQHLALGAGRARGRLDLPAESSAAGPLGGTVLVVADDGRRSRISLVDLHRLCASDIGATDDIVRRAIFSPSGDEVYEHRLERVTRRSLGIWRRLPDGSAERVLAPIEDDQRYGPTFTTELSWSADGNLLVVQSCGAAPCRTRLLDPGAGTVTTVASLDQGEVVGVADGRLLAYAACGGLPCPIVATEIGGGRAALIAENAGLALMIDTADGPRLVHEVGGPGSGAIRSVRPDGSAAVDRTVPRGLLLAPASARSGAGAEMPSGWVLLAGDGRPGHGPGPQLLLRPADGHTVRLDEVFR